MGRPDRAPLALMRPLPALFVCTSEVILLLQLLNSESRLLNSSPFNFLASSSSWV